MWCLPLGLPCTLLCTQPSLRCISQLGHQSRDALMRGGCRVGASGSMTGGGRVGAQCSTRGSMMALPAEESSTAPSPPCQALPGPAPYPASPAIVLASRHVTSSLASPCATTGGLHRALHATHDSHCTIPRAQPVWPSVCCLCMWPSVVLPLRRCIMLAGSPSRTCT